MGATDKRKCLEASREPEAITRTVGPAWQRDSSTRPTDRQLHGAVGYLIQVLIRLI